MTEPNLVNDLWQNDVRERDVLRATLALTEAALKNAQEQRDACAVEALEQRDRAEKAEAAIEMLHDALLEAGSTPKGAAAFQALKIAWLAKPPDWMVARELAAADAARVEVNDWWLKLVAGNISPPPFSGPFMVVATAALNARDARVRAAFIEGAQVALKKASGT